MESKGFLWNDENLKQAIGLQMAFILEVKPEDFLAKNHRFFN